ncbi:hypothetical protein BLNAU_10113 [Blattamonas nauphoetae]|uniref:TmcB/TmcC TPR repeats domain-containing protein n=1 Tax=Blattamonas nauphoetae TaxID=2049346 RepID=A0ABQ9XU17_9EUKA|nr:hypothetical protein BLNAU_10113 [Blattamonas nauphoetae]
MRAWQTRLFILPKSHYPPSILFTTSPTQGENPHLFYQQTKIIQSRVSSPFRAIRAVRLMLKHTPRDKIFVDYSNYLFNLAICKWPKNSQLILLYAVHTQQYSKMKDKAEYLFTAASRGLPPYSLRFYLACRRHSLASQANRASNSVDVADSQESHSQMLSGPGKELLDSTLHAHNLALHATKNFWHSLSQNNTSKQSSAHHLSEIVKYEQKARRGYEELLKMHPNNTFLLRLYAILLQSVCHDEESSSLLEARAELLGGGRDPDRSQASKISHSKQWRSLGASIVSKLGDAKGVTFVSTKRKSFFLLIQGMLHIVLILLVVAGMISFHNFANQSEGTLKQLETIHDTGRYLSRIALYSKTLLICNSSLYVLPPTLHNFPSAEECVSNLSSLSESLLATLNHVYSEPNTIPWEVEDSDLLLVSYLGTTITQRWFVSLTPFNAIGHVAYSALSAATEGQNSSLFLANLAEPVINVPTVLMESLKRMMQDYYVEDGKKISIAVVVNVVNVFVLQLTICVVLGVVTGWTMMQPNKRRERVNLLLLSLRRTEIFKQTISLLGAENETETIVNKWEKEGEKQEQEGSKTFHFVSDEEEEEEEEEEMKYAEEPVRVTIIPNSVVAGGEFKLSDLLDPHPLPPRPPAAEYNIITSVMVGDPYVIPKRVIRLLRKKRGVKMERKVMEEQNEWENGDEVEMVHFGQKRDRRRRRKRNVQSTHTTEETSMTNPFPSSPDNSQPGLHRPSLHKQPSSTAVLPQQFASAMSMPFRLLVARSESALPQTYQLDSPPPLPFSTREHLSRFNSISSPHLTFSTHTLPQLSTSPLNGSSGSPKMQPSPLMNLGLNRYGSTSLLSVVESEDMLNKSAITQLDMNAFTLLSPHKQSYPSLHTLTQSSVPSEPQVAGRRKLTEEEEEEEREMEEKGIVRDALPDEVLTRNLEESIETTGETIKTYKTGLFPTLCVLAVLMIPLVITGMSC